MLSNKGSKLEETKQYTCNMIKLDQTIAILVNRINFQFLFTSFNFDIYLVLKLKTETDEINYNGNRKVSRYS